MNKVTIATTATVALLATALSINVIAGSKDKSAMEEAQQTAAISLSQAVNIAEQATGGKKTDAEFDLEKDGQAKYEVELSMPDGSEVEVEIDATSGVIMSQTPDNKATDVMSQDKMMSEPMGNDSMSTEPMSMEHNGEMQEPEIVEEMMNEHKGDMYQKADDSL